MPQLLECARITAEITSVSMLLGGVFGLLVGIGRLNPARTSVYGMGTAYVAGIRGTHCWCRYSFCSLACPSSAYSCLPAFLCGVLGFGVYSGAYVSEIVRVAIQSIDQGQMEAARTFGFSSSQAMQSVILPQAGVRMIPPLGNGFIALIKNLAVVFLLTIHHLTHEGQKIISVSDRSLGVYLAIAVLYFVLTGLTTLALRMLEQDLKAGGMVQ